jgi:hypothetical protein
MWWIEYSTKLELYYNSVMYSSAKLVYMLVCTEWSRVHHKLKLCKNGEVIAQFGSHEWK